MKADWQSRLERWREAGLLSSDAVDRIIEWETASNRTERFEWPIILALILGGIAIGAGLLLFVAANWDRISPGSRFSLVLFLVGLFHFAGALSSRDSKPFQAALHGIGTVAFGAGIVLTGEIYHLPENWPAATFLWALGAFLAWLLLRDAVQLTLLGVLTPLWIGTQFAKWQPLHVREMLDGMLLLALTYLGAASANLHSRQRMALVWIGGLALLPLSVTTGVRSREPASLPLEALAFALPLGLAWMLRNRQAWPLAAFAAWIAVLHWLTTQNSFLVQLWAALGSVAVVAWGWHEGRKERINLGVAGFALSVLSFYVSNVLDKLGRSASLIALGLALLAGGWVLERIRRRLVASV